MLDNLQYPIIQAPMAGVTTPDFVVACAEAGILGSVGAGYFTAQQTKEFIHAVKAKTKLPFAVNLFVPENAEYNRTIIEQAFNELQPIRERFTIPHEIPLFSKEEYTQQIDILLEEKVGVVSFTFGLPTLEEVKRLQNQQIYLIGTATSLEEALKVQQCGLDAVIVQGIEAGGHRGTFLYNYREEQLSDLLIETRKVLTIPIIAAGGISNKGKMNEMLALGASAVQIGTALLATEESGANALHKKMVMNAEKESTILTTAFSGKLARGIKNEFITIMGDKVIAPYPFQNEMTKSIRKAAFRKGDVNYLSLWAGMNVHETKSGTVKEIIAKFMLN